MFGRSKPVVLFSHGSRPRRRVPRWLVLLVTGLVLGAGTVVFVEQRLMTPRLSATESRELRASFEQADNERMRLSAELANATKRLEAALSSAKRAGDEAATLRQGNERLRQDLLALAQALPPDPRGGTIQVRAARFSAEGGQLVYDVVLSRGERAASKPLSGVMQLLVAGAAARGNEATIKLEPVAISVGEVESLRGSLPLPEGFGARQATIHLLDRPDGKLLGMRVLPVK